MHFSRIAFELVVAAYAMILCSAQATASSPAASSWQEEISRAEKIEAAAGDDPNQLRAATSLYRQAAQSGDSEAQLLAGCHLFRRGAGIDQSEARALIRQSAEQKNPNAVFALAKFTAFGIGGDADETKALQLLNDARTLFRMQNQRQNGTPGMTPDVQLRRHLNRLCGPDITAWAKQRGLEVAELPDVRRLQRANE